MTEFKKIKATTAQAILVTYEQDPCFQETLNQQAGLTLQSPEAFMAYLLEHAELEQLVKFLAHALPRREAVWWACLVARQAQSNEPQSVKTALEVTEQWVMKPSEQKRREAEQWARLTEYQYAASWAAQAAFWSTGSMTPENEAPVPAPAKLYAHAVCGAVQLAAANGEPQESEKRIRRFIKQGIEIAKGYSGLETPCPA